MAVNGVAWIPLAFAGLCINHTETIFDIRLRRCPTCGATDFALLARWLRERVGER